MCPLGNDNPGPSELKTLHRFPDNCAQQFKCPSAFNHITQLKEMNDIEVIYHYTRLDTVKGLVTDWGSGKEENRKKDIGW